MSTPDAVARPLVARPDTEGVVVAVLALALLAWVALALLHGGALGGHEHAVVDPSPAHGHEHHHHAHPAVTRAAGPSVPMWALGWVTMVVAMMLPPALPLLRVVRRLAHRQPHPGRLVAIAATAFVSVWALAGLAYAAGDLALGQVAGTPGWTITEPAVLGGLATIAAGLYQFTALKAACLTACRSPLALALTTWTGRRPAAEVARVGLRFGLVCVGCCWALMALTFVVGVAAMPVMVGMAVVMAAERLLPQVRPLVPLVGAATVALGLGLLTGLVPAVI